LKINTDKKVAVSTNQLTASILEFLIFSCNENSAGLVYNIGQTYGNPLDKR